MSAQAHYFKIGVFITQRYHARCAGGHDPRCRDAVQEEIYDGNAISMNRCKASASGLR